jgi:E3 ubiquitin-protein ligase TRIP12
VTPPGASRNIGDGVRSGGSTKERVNEWIHSQVVSFMQRWVPPDEQHPALDAVRKLTDNVKKLKLSLSDYLEPLKAICSILVDCDTSISSFEVMHCSLVPHLTSFLTVENLECAVPLNARLRMFVHIFIGIPEQDTSLVDWSPPSQLGLVPLLQKLHGCVSRVEQFAVRVYDMPGRRGSQALRFFNTHQIKVGVITILLAKVHKNTLLSYNKSHCWHVSIYMYNAHAPSEMAW